MLGKLVQLLCVPMQDGFTVVEGVDFRWDGKADFEFATLELLYNPFKENYKVIHCWKVYLNKQHDGFKDFLVNNLALKNGPEEKEVEERLWVIIPHFSKIETTSERIAGRYPTETILEMKSGDIIKVNRTGEEPETYMAVQAGNELFLIKKHR